jgi:uncharacterized membrane protein YuzA (DUF378 family)
MMNKIIPKDKMGILDYIAVVLLIAGGLNWGFALIGLNLVDMLLDGFANIVYIAVGLSAIFSIYRFTRLTKKMKPLDYVAVGLLIAGGLNWLLVPFGINLVMMLGVWIGRIVYALVLASALYSIWRFIQIARK